MKFEGIFRSHRELNSTAGMKEIYIADIETAFDFDFDFDFLGRLLVKVNMALFITMSEANN